MSYIPPPTPQSEPEDLEDRLQELEFLQQLDNELHYVLDLNHVLDITLDWSMRRSAADTGLIARVFDDALHVMRVTGYAYKDAVKLMREPLSLETGVLGRAVRSERPIYMAYVSSNADHNLIYDRTHSHFTVPLKYNDNVVAVLHLESRHPAHFNLRMRNFIQHVAARAAVALRNAELYTRTHNAEQLKSDLIRMVAHDLRNPLNAIVNATHLLKRLRMQMPEPAFKFVQSIEQSAHHMRMLIEELLTLERLESGIAISADPVDLGRVVQEAISRTQGDAISKTQEFLVEVQESPVVVAGEFAYFRQAMVNLISNAVKYTPHRGTITIRLSQHGDRAFFDVTDSGYGISPERQKHLFQRFYRAKEPGTEHIEGTGLGLSLVKAIVERFEGEVWFRSEPNKGSTFGFWIPTLEGDVTAAAADNARREAENAYFKISAANRQSSRRATPAPLGNGKEKASGKQGEDTESAEVVDDGTDSASGSRKNPQSEAQPKNN
ncbi:MAG: GAF domain-containing protein [Chloroflexi bacterium]|nr:GAF domain-containing protein [Chloroflexota bacterium]